GRTCCLETAPRPRWRGRGSSGHARVQFVALFQTGRIRTCGRNGRAIRRSLPSRSRNRAREADCGAASAAPPGRPSRRTTENLETRSGVLRPVPLREADAPRRDSTFAAWLKGHSRFGGWAAFRPDSDPLKSERSPFETKVMLRGAIVCPRALRR